MVENGDCDNSVRAFDESGTESEDAYKIPGGYWVVKGSFSGTAYWNAANSRFQLVTGSYTYGLRPIIDLDKYVYVVGGTGTLDDPYQLKKISN